MLSPHYRKAGNEKKAKSNVWIWSQGLGMKVNQVRRTGHQLNLWKRVCKILSNILKDDSSMSEFGAQ